nr:MAG TPA: hypothetical protein [Caudoviricetes sp.]
MIDTFNKSDKYEDVRCNFQYSQKKQYKYPLIISC